MLRIKTIKDIERFWKRKVLPVSLLKELEEYFKELCESLTGEKEAWKTYNLESDGPILVLRSSDNIGSLKQFGIDPTETESSFVGPEFSTAVELDDGSRYYKTVVVLDNSCAVAIYSLAGVWNDLDSYLAEYLTD